MNEELNKDYLNVLNVQTYLEPREDNQQNGWEKQLEDGRSCSSFECNDHVDARIHSNGVVSDTISNKSLCQGISFSILKSLI